MDIWEILGIAYTLDINSIREAYHARVREIRPEENPEAFRRLQKAYQVACEYAVSMMSRPPISDTDAADREPVTELFSEKDLQSVDEFVEYIKQQRSIRSAQEEPRREKILRALRVPAIIVILLFCVLGMYLSDSQIILTPVGAAVLLYCVMQQIGNRQE